MLARGGSASLGGGQFTSQFPLVAGGVPATLDFDFANSRYYQLGQAANPLTLTTTSRASVGYAESVAGVWTSFLANVPRITNKGLLVEEARTNGIRNNSMQGAVAGSPGTTPTNWPATAGPTGLTRTISLGTTNGVEWIEFNFAGTASSTAGLVVIFEATTGVASVNGDIWADSVWISNSASTGITLVSLQHQLLDAGGASLSVLNVVTGLLNSTWGRVGGVVTNNSASTAFVRSRIVTNSITSGTVVNFTIRIGWPQMEKAASVTSPIRTTSAAVTRAADVVTVSTVPTFGASYTLFSKSTPDAPVAFAGNQYSIAASDGTTANRFGLNRLATTGRPQYALDTVQNQISATAWAQLASRKAAAAYAPGSQAGSFNGEAAAATASALTPAGLNRIELGANGVGALQLNGYLERVAVWRTTRLADAVLPGVTAP